MTTREQWKQIVEKSIPIGPVIPQDFEATAEQYNCRVVLNKTSVSSQINRLIKEKYGEATRMYSRTRIIHEISQREQVEKYLRWQAYRRMGEKTYDIAPGAIQSHKLTGYEVFFIDKPLYGRSRKNDPDAIALQICREGINLQEKESNLTRHMLNVGIAGLTLLELTDVDNVLGQTIRRFNSQMEPEAHTYHDQALKIIHELPAPLRTIHYLLDEQNETLETYAVREFPNHPALLTPQMDGVLAIADERGLGVTAEQLMQGREVMKLFAQGGAPFARHFMTCADPQG
jgi:hypothetical protein